MRTASRNAIAIAAALASLAGCGSTPLSSDARVASAVEAALAAAG